MELPSFAGVTIAPGDAVTPEALNGPSYYAEAFHEVYRREHRLEDLEHAPPLAPQACVFFEWTGAEYKVYGARNIKGFKRNAAGDVTIELDISSQKTDHWFPMVAPLREHGKPPILWWEYDDGARSANACRIRLAVAPSGDAWAEDCSFLFHAWMAARASGAAGTNPEAPPEGRGVVHRIAVDGVESAEHRQELLAFCREHRARFLAGHAPDGTHRRPQLAMAAFQVRPPPFELVDGEWCFDMASEGEVLWQAGQLESLAWPPRDASKDPDVPILHWRTKPLTWWRSALVSLRVAYDGIPFKEDPVTIRRTAPAGANYPQWHESGGLDFQLAWTVTPVLRYVVSVGVVLLPKP